MKSKFITQNTILQLLPKDSFFYNCQLSSSIFAQTYKLDPKTASLDVFLLDESKTLFSFKFSKNLVSYPQYFYSFYYSSLKKPQPQIFFSILSSLFSTDKDITDYYSYDKNNFKSDIKNFSNIEFLFNSETGEFTVNILICNDLLYFAKELAIKL